MATINNNTAVERQHIHTTPLLIVGCGIGSVIAECALRQGFEEITLVDSSKVSATDISGYNYTAKDLDSLRSETLRDRLLAINTTARIKALHCDITDENIASIIDGHTIAVNALDFKRENPLMFDTYCQKAGVTVVHPYNIGSGGLLAVISPDKLSLETINRKGQSFDEVSILEYVTSYMKYWRKPQSWLDDVIEEYKSIHPSKTHLPVASWLVASMCTELLTAIATGRKTRVFPEFYLSKVM